MRYDGPGFTSPRIQTSVESTIPTVATRPKNAPNPYSITSPPTPKIVREANAPMHSASQNSTSSPPISLLKASIQQRRSKTKSFYRPACWKWWNKPCSSRTIKYCLNSVSDHRVWTETLASCGNSRLVSNRRYIVPNLASRNTPRRTSRTSHCYPSIRSRLEFIQQVTRIGIW